MRIRIRSFACILLTVTALAVMGCGSSTTISPLNRWTWVNGSNIANQKGTYGTQGKAASSNVPGARSSAVTWTDSGGNLWLFGGTGYDSAGTQGALNDLWVYNGNQWIWVAGSNVVNQKGVYGTQGTAAAGNTPGARSNAVSWTDRAGNLWLFGGAGYDSAGNLGQLNDLWVYNRNGWTWVAGSNVVNQVGTYGTQGTSGLANTPGARSNAVSWTDAYGNLWLFGGSGYDSTGVQGQLNDLWVYNRSGWRWINGSNIVNQKGIYGTQGTGASTSVPGGRSNAVSWSDYYGNLWMFGGSGYDSAGTQGQLNDLWVYHGNQWIWINGSNAVNQVGNYGTQGKSASTNVPGARANAVSWTDYYGNLWLFGGSGPNASGTQGTFNDLWVYSGNQWTWVSGSNSMNQSGNYGTQGKTVSSNVPGARANPASWTDYYGNLWMFGGYGYDSAGTQGQLNDLWVYQP